MPIFVYFLLGIMFVCIWLVTIDQWNSQTAFMTLLCIVATLCLIVGLLDYIYTLASDSGLKIMNVC